LKFTVEEFYLIAFGREAPAFAVNLCRAAGCFRRNRSTLLTYLGIETRSGLAGKLLTEFLP
jgi:hypothetical protein